MKRVRVRVKLRLEGTLIIRCRDQYLAISVCDQPPEAAPKPAAKAVRRDHNAGGKSRWMEGFWNQPKPPLGRAIRDSNARY